MKQLLIIISLLLPLYSQPNRRPNDEGTLRELLQLNETQVLQLKTARKKHHEETRPLRQELKTLRAELLTQFKDSKAVTKIATRTGTIHKKLTIKMAKHMSEISGILTEAQLVQFIQFRSSHQRGKHQPKK